VNSCLEKQTKNKRSGAMVQMVEGLPSKCEEALSSIPSTAKRNEKRSHQNVTVDAYFMFTNFMACQLEEMLCSLLNTKIM
jgi:hypothetical protein